MVVVRLRWFKKRLEEIGTMVLLYLQRLRLDYPYADISWLTSAPHILRPQLCAEQDTEAQLQTERDSEDVSDVASLQEIQYQRSTEKNDEAGVNEGPEILSKLVAL